MLTSVLFIAQISFFFFFLGQLAILCRCRAGWTIVDWSTETAYRRTGTVKNTKIKAKNETFALQTNGCKRKRRWDGAWQNREKIDKKEECLWDCVCLKKVICVLLLQLMPTLLMFGLVDACRQQTGPHTHTEEKNIVCLLVGLQQQNKFPTKPLGMGVNLLIFICLFFPIFLMRLSNWVNEIK